MVLSIIAYSLSASEARILCVQRDGADRLVAMLDGAIAVLPVGDPRRLRVGVGAVSDDEARASIERHISAMRERGRRVTQPARGMQGAPARGSFVPPARGSFVPPARGSFVPPTLIEIERLSELAKEVFGPVLHVLRYEREALPDLVGQINATEYGLTFGVHTRIDETVARVVKGVHAGNVYVNRNIVGAIVGVQPFGGEGLSGTGPKAGGPLYLLRLLARKPPEALKRAINRPDARPAAAVRGFELNGQDRNPLLSSLRHWAETQGDQVLLKCRDRLVELAPRFRWQSLVGPTGEANLYSVQLRKAVLCLSGGGGSGSVGNKGSDARKDLVAQLAAVLAVRGRAVWPSRFADIHERLPEDVRERITLADDWSHEAVAFDAVLHHAEQVARIEVLRRVAAKPGPIVAVSCLDPGDTAVPLDRLVVERSASVNTAAAGGNASVMAVG